MFLPLKGPKCTKKCIEIFFRRKYTFFAYLGPLWGNNISFLKIPKNWMVFDKNLGTSRPLCTLFQYMNVRYSVQSIRFFS